MYIQDFKITPAPWEAIGTTIINKDNFRIADTTDTAILHKWDKTGAAHWSERCNETYIELSEEEAEANAKLIAASPDLLNACLTLIQQAEVCHYQTEDGFHKLTMNRAFIEIKEAVNKAIS
jgi:hypothetical protein